MRRSIVSLSLLVVISVLWLAGSAGATHRMPRIACPVSDSRIIPCCPLPTNAGEGTPDVQPVCCQIAAACCPSGVCCSSGTCCTLGPCAAGTVTIASSPNPSTAGRNVVISGRWVGKSASAVPVELWRKLAGQSGFQQMAQTTTDSAGGYTFTLAGGSVMSDQAWYAASNGVHSTTIDQHVLALVGLSSSAHSTTVGQAVVLRGHVTPSHAGQIVLIERKSGHAWRVIARPRLGRGSSYAVSHRFSQTGALELRVVFGGDARNDRSVSRTVTVSIKR